MKEFWVSILNWDNFSGVVQVLILEELINYGKQSLYTSAKQWREIVERDNFVYVTSKLHYADVIISTIASEITILTIVCSNVYSGVDQRKHQNSASLASVREIHQWPVDSSHRGPVTRKYFHLTTSSWGKIGKILYFFICLLTCLFTYS